MKNIYLAMAVAFTIVLGSCSNNEEIRSGEAQDTVAVTNDAARSGVPREGDLCSVVKDSTGKSFGIIKILKIEGETYHLRTYGVSYEARPAESDLKDIKEGSAGIGHLPLSKAQFDQWKPEVILNQPVSLEELEGYNIWKNGQK